MTDPQRFHLTLTANGRAVAEGWWADEVVARAKFRDWIGEFGNLAQARVTLVDEETDDTLAVWPEQD